MQDVLPIGMRPESKKNVRVTNGTLADLSRLGGKKLELAFCAKALRLIIETS